MIDFTIPTELAQKRERVADWIRREIVPCEVDSRVTQHGPNDDLRQELIEKARDAGLLTIQAPKDLGGWGLSFVEQAVLYEASGWSTLGPVAMNCAAPDEGNMRLLQELATPDQAAIYLDPLISGLQRSVFAMTEPNGAGSDPRQLQTTAVYRNGNYYVNGRKWLITGAKGAKTWIIMANLAGSPSTPVGPTLFLAHGDEIGLNIERVMGSMDRNYVEGHCVVNFDDLELPEESVLGQPGEALRYAQMRLVPARLTHCMRWLGAAVRTQSIAIEHARNRTSFGKPIGEHQGVSFQLVDNEIALHQCRLTVLNACWGLDNDRDVRVESSMAKVFVSEELFKVADRCVQVLGGMGVTDETPVATIFRDLRGFRLYDGPTEVHKFAIARTLLRSPQ